MKIKNSNFVDYVKIFCRSGKGGKGSTHFLRDRNTAKGGPDGGDGGSGGHIILKGNDQMWTLLHLKYKKHVFAGDGESGSSNQKIGKDGYNNTLEVPLGTIVKNADNGEVVCEITSNNEEKIILKGGKGGKGNVHFKSSTNQTPRYAQPGIDSQEGWFILELKILADVGLVGFPNAGKSTFLNYVSSAKPKIGSYPFTTLRPHLGTIKGSESSYVIADIPGLIEGASDGAGLGTKFLKHISRTGLLLIFVDLYSTDDLSPTKQTSLLYKELETYKDDLTQKISWIVCNKIDLLEEDELMKIKADILTSHNLSEDKIFMISAATGNGIDHLLKKLETEVCKN